MKELESMVLGEILYSQKDKQLDALIQLNSQDFTNDTLNKIYKSACDIASKGMAVDSIGLMQRVPDEITAINYLATQYDTDVLLQQHIYALKEQTYKRALVESIEENLVTLKASNGLDGAEEAKSKIIADLSGINVGDQSRFINFPELRNKLFENIESNHKIEGVSWGSEVLDLYTSGIIVPRLYILGGLKKGGKSRFVINLIRQLSMQRVKNVFLSLEMPAYEIVKLIHASFSGIDDLKLRSKTYISNEERVILKNTVIPKEYFDVECQSSLTVESVLGRIRRYAKQGYKVIFIDYLQRIDHDRNKQAQELEKISVKIADATRANDVSVILLSQLSNLAEREIPTVGHLKGSGGIGEAADVVMLFDNLYRRTKQEVDKGKIDLYLEQRYGDSGVVHLISQLGICDIKDLDTRYEQ